MRLWDWGTQIKNCFVFLFKTRVRAQKWNSMIVNRFNLPQWAIINFILVEFLDFEHFNLVFSRGRDSVLCRPIIFIVQWTGQSFSLILSVYFSFCHALFPIVRRFIVRLCFANFCVLFAILINFQRWFDASEKPLSPLVWAISFN